MRYVKVVSPLNQLIKSIRLIKLKCSQVKSLLTLFLLFLYILWGASEKDSTVFRLYHNTECGRYRQKNEKEYVFITKAV